jgi:hypothetical protein
MVIAARVSLRAGAIQATIAARARSQCFVAGVFPEIHIADV